MNPVAMTIINHRKEYWQSLGSNQGPPLLKSATLSTGLSGSAFLSVCDSLENIMGKGENAGYLTSILFFSMFNVFERLPSQGHQRSGLWLRNLKNKVILAL